MVVRGRTRNASGCFAGCLHITRGNVNFDVLTGFKACLNDAFSNNILTATVPSFKADLRYTNRKFAMKIYLEMYRSGRNENDSKSNWLFGSGFPVLLGFMRVFRLREGTIFWRSLLQFSPKFSQNARRILKFNIWSITQVVVRGRTRNHVSTLEVQTAEKPVTMRICGQVQIVNWGLFYPVVLPNFHGLNFAGKWL